MDPEEQEQQQQQASSTATAPVVEAPKPKRKTKPKGELRGPVEPDPEGLALAEDVKAAATLEALAVSDALRTVVDRAAAAGTERQANEETEELGLSRDALVVAIGDLMTRLAAFQEAKPDAELVAKVHRYVNKVTPFYSQRRNVDILEQTKKMPKNADPDGEDKWAWNTRTCNISCVAIVLEQRGRDVSSYGDMAVVEHVADAFLKDPATENTDLAHAELQVKDKGLLAGLRLPDFLELACIAEKCTKQSTHAEILQARRDVWYEITRPDMSFLAQIAARFGVTMEKRKLTNSAGKEVSTMRNRDAYREAVTEQVGAELDAGKAIVIHLLHHYVKLQSIEPDGIVVDDVGSARGANTKVTWKQAQAKRYFQHWYVFA